MFNVKKLSPRNLEEALEFSEDFIKERAAVLKKIGVASNQQQQKIAAKQKMESSDGTTPTIMKADNAKKKVFVTKAGKLDWTAMQADALARMNSME